MSNLNVLKRRDFRRYYLSAVAGVNGMWIFRVLLSWTAWDLSGSASFVGLIAALSLLPVALIGPFFGALIDSLSIRKSFVCVSLALMACPAVFVALVASGALVHGTLILLAAAFGIAMSAYHPVRTSIGPRLVAQDEIGAVVALSALNFNIGRVVSPVIGGVVIASVGVTLTGAISALLFLPNLMIIAGVSPRALPPRPRRGVLQDLIDGARVARFRPTAWRAILVASLGLGPVRALSEVLPLLADGIFQRGAEGLGLLTSCIGAGALVAAGLQVLVGHRLLAVRALPWVVLALGTIGTLGMVWLPSFAVAATAATLNGFTSAYLAVLLQTSMQSDLPDEMRGRVMSLWMVAVTLSTSTLAIAVSLGTDWIGLPQSVTLVLAVGLVSLGLAVRKTP